jgi:hypothetical protein
METNERSFGGLFKAAVAVCGSVVFLTMSAVVASRARHYQVAGQPMPNGKGGFMTAHDGYLLALVFLVLAVAWFLAALRYWFSRLD